MLVSGNFICVTVSGSGAWENDTLWHSFAWLTKYVTETSESRPVTFRIQGNPSCVLLMCGRWVVTKSTFKFPPMSQQQFTLSGV